MPSVFGVSHDGGSFYRGVYWQSTSDQAVTDYREAAATALAAIIGGRHVRISFDIGDQQHFHAELYDNTVAQDFAALLPVDVVFNDFNNVEKVARLDRALRVRGVPDRDAPSPGEVGYYAPTQGLVLYYGHVGSWPGLVRLGRFTLDLDILRQLPDGTTAHITRT